MTWYPTERKKERKKEREKEEKRQIKTNLDGWNSWNDG